MLVSLFVYLFVHLLLCVRVGLLTQVHMQLTELVLWTDNGPFRVLSDTPASSTAAFLAASPDAHRPTTVPFSATNTCDIMSEWIKRTRKRKMRTIHGLMHMKLMLVNRTRERQGGQTQTQRSIELIIYMFEWENDSRRVRDTGIHHTQPRDLVEEGTSCLWGGKESWVGGRGGALSRVHACVALMLRVHRLQEFVGLLCGEKQDWRGRHEGALSELHGCAALMLRRNSKVRWIVVWWIAGLARKTREENQFEYLVGGYWCRKKPYVQLVYVDGKGRHRYELQHDAQKSAHITRMRRLFTSERGAHTALGFGRRIIWCPQATAVHADLIYVQVVHRLQDVHRPFLSKDVHA